MDKHISRRAENKWVALEMCIIHKHTLANGQPNQVVSIPNCLMPDVYTCHMLIHHVFKNWIKPLAWKSCRLISSGLIGRPWRRKRVLNDAGNDSFPHWGWPASDCPATPSCRESGPRSRRFPVKGLQHCQPP